MIYGYARVSTKGQARDGNSLAVQDKELRQAGAVEVYSDAITGTTLDRPELDKLLKKLRAGDILVVTKLDRIARNLRQGLDIIDNLLKRGVKVNILNMGMIDNDTPTGALIYQIMLCIAEFDRKIVLERMREGKEISGHYGGRKKKFSDAQLRHAVELLNKSSYSEVVKMTGISKSTLQRAKKVYRTD